MIMCIDTAVDSCSVSLSWEGQSIDSISNPEARKASEILHLLIEDLLSRNKHTLKDIKAIAINGGPGSYTGLRIAAASAKGLCYALEIPLIHLDGLQLMTSALIKRKHQVEFDYFIPMIDARRNEVFTAVFDFQLNYVLSGQPMIIEINSFERFKNNRVILFGNGAEKSSHIMNQNEVSNNKGFTYITDFKLDVNDFNYLVWLKWKDKIFENIYTYKPNYLKKFYSTAKT